MNNSPMVAYSTTSIAWNKTIDHWLVDIEGSDQALGKAGFQICLPFISGVSFQGASCQIHFLHEGAVWGHQHLHLFHSDHRIQIL